MDKKFDVSKAALLDRPERKILLPIDPILEFAAVKAGMHVADVGCGTGYFTIPLAKLVKPNGRVLAIDISREMLERLKSKIKGIPTVEPVFSEEEKIPLPAESVDLVFTGTVFHEFEGDPTLKEIWRILKQEGTFVVVDWQKIASELGPPLEHRKSEEEVRRLVEPIGFSLEKSRKFGLFYELVFVKK